MANYPVCKCLITRQSQLKGDGSFEHPKHMYKLMGKKIIIILGTKSYIHVPYLDLWIHLTTSE